MFLVSRPSKRFSTSSLQQRKMRSQAVLLSNTVPSPAWSWQAMSPERHSLIHVESQRNVLILGEEKDQEVVTGLALLDGGIQADLARKSRQGLAPGDAP